MLLFGINFNLFYFALIRRFSSIWKSEELRAYLLICVASTALIVWNTYSMFSSVSSTIRTAFFQVSSIMSTTGFTTFNFDLWPALSKTVLIILLVFGACGGSTAGGLKISRLLILKKLAVRELKYLLHPKSVHVIRIDDEVLPEETVRATAGYLVLYLMLALVFFLCIAWNGLDMVTNVTAVLTCPNNVGPGLNLVGPTGNFSVFSSFSKIILSLAMLIGRLEILPFAVLLSPSVWKKPHRLQ
jgi:trk system potassium uptake protein TrkH